VTTIRPANRELLEQGAKCRPIEKGTNVPMNRWASIVAVTAAVIAGAGATAWAREAGHRLGAQAFVVNRNSDAVTPVNLAAGIAGPPIKVGRHPDAIAGAPDGSTVYIANGGSGTVTPINVETDAARRPIRVGAHPVAITVSPNGRTAYVVDDPVSAPGTVVPIRTATGRPGAPIRVGGEPIAIAVTPDGRTALVLNAGAGNGPNYLTFVNTRMNTASKPLVLPGYVYAIAIAPGGRTAYVAGSGRMMSTSHGEAWQGLLTPLNIARHTKGRSIVLGHDIYMGNEAPDAVTFSRSGTMAYAIYPGINAMVPVRTASGRAESPVHVAGYPVSATVAAGGRKLYIASAGAPAVTEVNLSTMVATAIKAGPGPAGPPFPVLSVITTTPHGDTVYVLGDGRTTGTLTPIPASTDIAGKPIPVGANPVAIDIVR
jgi:YVTN family beta-propeller protein